jgi:transposase
VRSPGPTRHRDGFAIWYKRLEEGSYAMPFGEQCEISGAELSAILSGIDLAKAERRKRYERKRAATA